MDIFDCLNTAESPDMAIYDYIVNHLDTCGQQLPELIGKMRIVDLSGQFLASTARFLAAVDAEAYGDVIPELVEATIEKDREHRYIGGLLAALWGPDYESRADELRATDNNFRRIYKRLYPSGF